MKRWNNKRESGIALLQVIASGFLISLIILALVSVAMFTSGKAGASRAKSQAVAAAEGGLEAAASALLADTANQAECVWGATGGVGLSYRVDSIQYRASGKSRFTDCTSGSIPQNADAVKIAVTGLAKDPNQRNKSGNEARMERVFERQSTKDLDAAVFSGTVIDPGNGMISLPKEVNGAGGDIVSHDKFTCRTAGPSTYTGNVYALNGMMMANDCYFSGDLYIRSNTTVSLSNYVEVTGKLVIDAPKTVVGNKLLAKSEVFVKGDLQIGGSGATFESDLEVQGNVTATVPFTVKKSTLITGDANFGGGSNKVFSGELRVGGSFSAGNPQVFKSNTYFGGAFNHSGGPSTFERDVFFRSVPSGSSASALTGVVGQIHTPSAIAGVPVGKMTVHSDMSPYFLGASWQLTPQEMPDAADPQGFAFPILTWDDPRFGNWQTLSKLEFGQLLNAKAETFNTANCSFNTNQTIELTFDRPTKIDLRGCAWNWGWKPKLIINTDSDFAIFADSMNLNAGGGSGLTIRGKTDRALGDQNPKAYLVVPAKSSTQTCPPVGSGSLYINRANVPLIQTGSAISKDDTKVTVDLVLYSSGELKLGNNDREKPLYAQLYGCKVTSDGVLTLKYSPAGSGDETLRQLLTTSLRDITN